MSIKSQSFPQRMLCRKILEFYNSLEVLYYLIIFMEILYYYLMSGFINPFASSRNLCNDCTLINIFIVHPVPNETFVNDSSLQTKNKTSVWFNGVQLLNAGWTTSTGGCQSLHWRFTSGSWVCSGRCQQLMRFRALSLPMSRVNICF